MNALTDKLAAALLAMEQHAARVCDGYPPSTMGNAWEPYRKAARAALAEYDAQRAKPTTSAGDHTPEPWTLRYATPFPGALPLIHVRGGAGGFFNVVTVGCDDPRVDDEANARRIVACVNACAGIPTETLEHGVVRTMNTLTDKLAAARGGSACCGSSASTETKQP